MAGYRTKPIQTGDISPVRTVAGFVHVQKLLTDLPNINRHKFFGMDTPNVMHIENGH